jgi:hypothetical protein
VFPPLLTLWLWRIRSLAAAIAIIGLVGLSIRSEYLRLAETIAAVRAHTPDFVVSYSRRIAGVGPLVPTHGTLGYLSDQTDTGQFFATQYLLAPLAVIKGDQADWVIVNNHPPGITDNPGTSYTESDKPDGSKIYDFGNGIQLIDKRPGR